MLTEAMVRFTKIRYLTPSRVRSYDHSARKLVGTLGRISGGLLLSTSGAVLGLRAHVGVSPWDVFHTGLSHSLTISFGTAVLSTGIVLLIVSWILGVRPGLGSVVSMLMPGPLADAALATGVGANFVDLPLFMRYILLAAGLFIAAVGGALFISSGLGAGRRDAILLAITTRSGLKVGWARLALEFLACGIGWLIGGQLGFGTVVWVALSGPATSLAFKFIGLDNRGVRRTLSQVERLGDQEA